MTESEKSAYPMEAGSERWPQCMVLVPPTGKTKSNKGLMFWPIATSFHLRAGGLGKDIGMGAKIPLFNILRGLY